MIDNYYAYLTMSMDTSHTHNTTFSPQGQQSIPEIPSRSVGLLGDAMFTPSGLALQDPATYNEGY